RVPVRPPGNRPASAPPAPPHAQSRAGVLAPPRWLHRAHTPGVPPRPGAPRPPPAAAARAPARDREHAAAVVGQPANAAPYRASRGVALTGGMITTARGGRGAVIAGSYAVSCGNEISNSCIFLRSVFRLMPRIEAALTWLPRHSRTTTVSKSFSTYDKTTRCS